MRLTAVLASIVLALVIGGAQSPPSATQAADAVAIDADDIGGVVTGPKGPEAGVWVIAETTELPTKFARIVVTDDRGRYLMPDLPKANYDVWVRGYGLVDSPSSPGGGRQTAQPDGRHRARPARGRAVLSGRLLVFADAGAGQERVSRDRRPTASRRGCKTQAEWLRT